MRSVLKVEDAGLYACLASSLAGEDGKSHWVRVQGDTSCSLKVIDIREIHCIPASFPNYAQEVMNKTQKKITC